MLLLSLLLLLLFFLLATATRQCFKCVSNLMPPKIPLQHNPQHIALPWTSTHTHTYTVQSKKGKEGEKTGKRGVAVAEEQKQTVPECERELESVCTFLLDLSCESPTLK